MIVSPSPRADLQIIGGGIAGWCLAYIAARHSLSSNVFSDKQPGTTYSATGILSPRVDYFIDDREFAEETVRQCLRWKRITPSSISLRPFLLPIDHNIKWPASILRHVFSSYDSLKSSYARKSEFLSRRKLEKVEPNIKRGYFEGAIKFTEYATDPIFLLEEMRDLAILTKLTREIPVKDISSFSARDKEIQEIVFRDPRGEVISVSNKEKPLIVVNATGPWLSITARHFGITFDLDFRLGIQIVVEGEYLNHPMFTFNSKGKHIICWQKGKYIQIGPSNTPFTGDPNQTEINPEDVRFLLDSFNDVLECPTKQKPTLIKRGLRPKLVSVLDTNRPVIWPHNQDPENPLLNFYSLNPGKMVSGLLVADEVLRWLAKDGLLKLEVPNEAPRYSLNGYEWNTAWLLAKKLWSRAALATDFAKKNSRKYLKSQA